MSSKAYELLARIKSLCLISGTSEDDTILRMMNEVQWQLYSAHYPWRSLQDNTTTSTTDGTAYVAVPSTTAMIYTVRQTSDSPYSRLTYLSVPKFHEVIPQPTAYSEGKPVYYSWWDSKLWLYPIPDDTYTLTIYGYKKPVNMKIYSVGTAANTTTAWTGTSTYWSTNANVDSSMYLAYQADIRSDGTFPWVGITTVTSATAITAAATYTGGTATGAYVAASPSTFDESFDLLLIYGTIILYGTTRLRDKEDLIKWSDVQYTKLLTNLIEVNKALPDFTPVMEDFSSGGSMQLGDSAYKFPFIVKDF